MALITVRFYGRLKAFGDRFQLEVRDTAEAVRALMAQLPKLRQQLQQGFYKVRIGKYYLNPEALDQGLFYRLKKGMTLHFIPVIKGAKKAGVFNLIVGAVLVAASWYAGGAAGWSYLGASGYGMATMGTMLGASMMLSGVSQMLTKTPSMGGMVDDKSRQSSTAFSSLQNMAAQGQPVPLAYGQIRCSSMIISQGVETMDEVEENNNGGGQAGGSPTTSTASPSNHHHTTNGDRHRSTEREEKDRAERERQERERNSRMARDIF